MYKSIVIILGIAWLLFTVYLSMALFYGYPHEQLARVGSMICSVLLLASIIIYIKKHKK